jgi:fumarate hydratase class II
MIRWGTQTRLAVANFPISGEPMPRAVIRAIAQVKAEAAAVNLAHGVIDGATAGSIVRAADEVLDGAFDDQFPVDVFQTGSGTSTNMNVNEVIAHRATELAGVDVHPNDHVNASQSSNDVVPSALRIAAAHTIERALLPALRGLHHALAEQSRRHRDTVTLGRTHLMDAVPITFGQEAGGWARAVELGVERLEAVMPRLLELPLGGTAVGTGLNAPPRFGAEMAARLAARTGLTLVEAADHFEAQGHQEVFVEVSGAVRAAAMGLHTIAMNVRLLGSGPTGGLGELVVPELQAGSSIMPGKVNPVIAEVVQQVAAQVVGNDAAITFAAGTTSMLQLGTGLPVIARNLMSSLDLLTAAATVFDERCIRGLLVDAERMRTAALGSPALVTALAPRIGYDAASRLVHLMSERGESLAEVARTEGVAGIDDLDLLALARPHRTVP